MFCIRVINTGQETAILIYLPYKVFQNNQIIQRKPYIKDSMSISEKSYEMIDPTRIPLYIYNFA